jgi:hypothetical protein
MHTDNNIVLSKHAQTRSQQRGIQPSAMEVLAAYGASKFSHGCEVLFMDRSARQRARAALGKNAYAKVEPSLNTYLVLADDGAVITCAHRTCRRLKAA